MIGILFPIICLSQVTADKNYIKKSVYTEPVKIGEEDISNKVNEIITYLDGGSKTIQTSYLNFGGENEDINYSYEYDAAKRQSKKFLPYPSRDDGSFLANYDVLIAQYYNSEKYEYTQNPFEEILFDDHSFNRIGQIAHPGNDFAMDQGHTLKYNYFYNNASDNVRNYFVKYNDLVDPTKPVLGEDGYRPIKSLLKKVIKNENWSEIDGKNKTTEYYSDIWGRKILRKFYIENEVYETYYIYDSQNNLTFIMPPMAGNIQDGSEYEKYFYQYRYDAKNRLVEKKIPGSGWIYILYDELNRPILTQDAVQREAPNSPWNFVRYDILGRVVYSGIVSAAGFTKETLKQHIAIWSPYEARTSTPQIISGTTVYYSIGINLPVNLQQINYYDDYSFDAGGLYMPAVNYYNEDLNIKTNSLVTGVKSVIADQSGNLGWENKVIGYDKKHRQIYSISNNTYTGVTNITDNKLDFTGNILQTRTIHSKLGVVTNLTSFDYYYYDHAGRLVRHSQKIANNPVENVLVRKYDELGILKSEKVGGRQNVVSSGITINNNILTKTGSSSWITGTLETGALIRDGFFSFKVLNANSSLTLGLTGTPPASTTYLQMKYSFFLSPSSHPSGGNTVRIYEVGIDRGIITNYHPDDEFTIERIYKIIHYKKNGKTIYTSPIYTLETLYGDVHLQNNGSPIADLQLHSSFEHTSSLQIIDYKYDIQGRLTKINDITNLGTDLFAFEIKRNNPIAGTPIYNNNVSQTFWKTANSPSVLRNYTYHYDDADRYLKAEFTRSENQASQTGAYNEQLSYDKNGNIRTLRRFGMSETAPLCMDKLAYGYNGNQVTTINDMTSVADGFNDGATSNEEYLYDSNGNVIRDYNKGITSITYNSNNLPLKVSFSTDKFIKYTYSDDGIKISKEVTNGSNITTTLYAGNYTYEKINSAPFSLKFFSSGIGYISFNAGNTRYVYQYKDHVGNIRLSYSDQNNNGEISLNEIIDESNYYPLGLKHKGYNNIYNNIGSEAYNFGFQSQELNEALGLNWIEYRWRNYDPAIGRFFSSDPLAEKYNWISPYQFSSNQPVHAPELEGMESQDAADWNEEDQEYVVNGDFNQIGNNKNYDLIEVLVYAQERQKIENFIDADISNDSDLYDEDGIGRVVVGITPFLGSSLDIYEGVKNGNSVQATIGIATLAFDICTLGTSSILVGGVKAGAFAWGVLLLKEGAEKVSKEAVEQVAVQATKTSTSTALVKYDAKFAVSQGLEGGKFNFNKIRSMIPEGTPNTFNPAYGGEKYIFNINGTKIQLKWHTPEFSGNAPFGSNSSLFNTAQIKVGNKYLMQFGGFTRNGYLNSVHTPLK